MKGVLSVLSSLQLRIFVELQISPPSVESNAVVADMMLWSSLPPTASYDALLVLLQRILVQLGHLHLSRGLSDVELIEDIVAHYRSVDEVGGTGNLLPTALKTAWFLCTDEVLAIPCAEGGPYYALMAFRGMLLKNMWLFVDPSGPDLNRVACLWVQYEQALYEDDIACGLHPEIEPGRFADTYRHHALRREDILNGGMWNFWLRAMERSAGSAGRPEEGFVIMFFRYFGVCAAKDMAECLLPRLLPLPGEDTTLGLMAAVAPMTPRLLTPLNAALPHLLKTDLDGDFTDGMVRRCLQLHEMCWLETIARKWHAAEMYLTKKTLVLLDAQRTDVRHLFF